MDELLETLKASGIPFAYDHFAEGESPEPPFICYLLPDSDNFSADGKAYYKVNEVHIELYTDTKDLSVERQPKCRECIWTGNMTSPDILPELLKNRN